MEAKKTRVTCSFIYLLFIYFEIYRIVGRRKSAPPPLQCELPPGLSLGRSPPAKQRLLLNLPEEQLQELAANFTGVSERGKETETEELRVKCESRRCLNGIS